MCAFIPFLLEGTALVTWNLEWGRAESALFFGAYAFGGVCSLHLRPRSGQRLKQIFSVAPPKLKTADILVDAFCVTQASASER